MNNPMIRVPLKYGAAGGLMVILAFLVLFFLDDNPLLVLPPIDFVLLPLFLFFSVKDFRDNHNGKVMYFWEGMTVGFFCYISVAILSGLFVLGFLEVCNCNLLADFITNKVAVLESEKARVIEEMGQATYDKTLSDTQATTTFIIALDVFLKKCILGLLFTIMLSMILRTKPKN